MTVEQKLPWARLFQETAYHRESKYSHFSFNFKISAQNVIMAVVVIKQWYIMWVIF